MSVALVTTNVPVNSNPLIEYVTNAFRESLYISSNQPAPDVKVIRSKPWKYSKIEYRSVLASSIYLYN